MPYIIAVKIIRPRLRLFAAWTRIRPLREGYIVRHCRHPSFRPIWQERCPQSVESHHCSLAAPCPSAYPDILPPSRSKGVPFTVDHVELAGVSRLLFTSLYHPPTSSTSPTSCVTIYPLRLTVWLTTTILTIHDCNLHDDTTHPVQGTTTSCSPQQGLLGLARQESLRLRTGHRGRGSRVDIATTLIILIPLRHRGQRAYRTDRNVPRLGNGFHGLHSQFARTRLCRWRKRQTRRTC